MENLSRTTLPTLGSSLLIAVVTRSYLFALLGLAGRLILVALGLALLCFVVQQSSSLCKVLLATFTCLAKLFTPLAFSASAFAPPSGWPSTFRPPIPLCRLQLPPPAPIL